MINSNQYQKHAIKSRYPYLLTFKRYWKPMLGTCESVRCTASAHADGHSSNVVLL
jgi:hypothetical protein